MIARSTIARSKIAHSIGSVAGELLRQPQDAVVMGVTSRGVFLRLACGWVVFVTPEPYPGPLTIQLDEPLPPVLTQKGASLNLELISPLPLEEGPGVRSALLLHASPAAVWEPPPRPATATSIKQRTSTLAAVCRHIAAQPPRGFSFLLPYASGLHPSALDATHQLVLKLHLLASALHARQPIPLADAASAFLGLGGGLTPSGDDLLLGLLLSLRRWGDLLAPGLEVDSLSAHLLQGAYSTTTTLSANLIECASRGLADARLVLALDGLVTGGPGPDEIYAALAGWGSSSGIDALLGMALVVAG
jgi:hypothetical protein